MLCYSLVFAVCSYFGFYHELYVYLPDALGYSMFTNLFMFMVYLNKRYCTATKVSVIGLFALNFMNMLYYAFDIDGVVYDIYLILIVLMILILKKL